MGNYQNTNKNFFSQVKNLSLMLNYPPKKIRHAKIISMYVLHADICYFSLLENN